jgi:DNA-binding beta-propeller fold protein YncE
MSADGSTLYASGTAFYEIATPTNQVTAQIPLPSTAVTSTALMTVNPVQPAAYYAYQQASSGYSSLAVIDLANLSITNTFALPASPLSIGVSPDGKSIFVGTGVPNLVTALDSKTDQVVGAIEIPGVPIYGAYAHASVVSPDSGSLFVGFNPYSPLQPGIAVVDAATLRVAKSVLLNGSLPLAMALSPDGSTLYVGTAATQSPTSNIEVYDALSLTLKTTLAVANDGDLLVSRDAKFLFVAQDSAVVKVDIASGQIVASAALPSGFSESNMVLSPAGDMLYVGSYPFLGDTLVAIATGSFSLAASLPYCGENLAISPDGKTLYSDGCFSATTDTVDLIDPATDTLRNAVTVPVIYTRLSITPDGRQLWIPAQNPATLNPGIVSIDLESGRSTVIHTFSDGPVVMAPRSAN